MFDYLWRDITTHFVIYGLLLFLVIVSVISLYHVFWACVNTRNRIRKSKSEREKMMQVIKGCPLTE